MNLINNPVARNFRASVRDAKKVAADTDVSNLKIRLEALEGMGFRDTFIAMEQEGYIKRDDGKLILTKKGADWITNTVP